MLLVTNREIDDDLRLVLEPIVERNEEACDASRLVAPSTSNSWIFNQPSQCLSRDGWGDKTAP
jgi:hypothetical protein